MLLKSTGVVMKREAPIAFGLAENFNSLASPPALLVVEIDQLSAELSDVVHPSGIDIESKVSLKMTDDDSCAKTTVATNNANVSSNVFFIFLFFAVSSEQRAMSDAHNSQPVAHCLINCLTMFPSLVFILIM